MKNKLKNIKDIFTNLKKYNTTTSLFFTLILMIDLCILIIIGLMSLFLR